MDAGEETGARSGRGAVTCAGATAGDGATAGAGAAQGRTGSGRVPLAVAVVDREGLVSHWSTGARRLFGTPREVAVGRPAADLLPVSGALPDDEPGRFGVPADVADTGVTAVVADTGDDGDTDGPGPGPGSSLDRGPSHPAAGRARQTVPGGDRIDVLWWAYPLVGPGPGRLLVLTADAGALRGEGTAAERIAPGFALHTDFPGAAELARGLPGIMPAMSVAESARTVAQVLALGYPVLEFGRNGRVPVTPDRGVPGRARRTRPDPAAGGGTPDAEDTRADDLEFAAVRERLEFWNEPGSRIGTCAW